MPTYQYACTECGHGFETVQSFTDDARTDCPQCTGRLRKVFNSVGIVFKGSGFYRTDSREKPSSTKDKADASTAKNGAKDGAKDSKPSRPSSDSDSAKTTSSTASSSSSSSTSSTAGSAA